MESPANPGRFKYEIEKSIEKKNGLLGVLIHDMKDSGGKTDNQGVNPLGEYRKNNFGKKVTSALVEGAVAGGLTRLLFPQLAIPATIVGACLALLKQHDDYRIYDWFEDNGYKNLGDWIEKAAQQVGR